MVISVLVINPNSTQSMTDGLQHLLAGRRSGDTKFTFFTSPSGPASIDDDKTADESAHHALPHVLPLLPAHDGVLVACYSAHPLVPLLKQHTRAPVVGIFEASVCAALLLLRPGAKFGIVSTGQVWETLLSRAVAELLQAGNTPFDSWEGQRSGKFAGVETTGLNAVELHTTAAAEVAGRVREAVKRLVRRGSVEVVCLGCAGMAGMYETVREGCVEELGETLGGGVRIVDGVKVGVGVIESLVAADIF